jgi:hypothetical protein
MSLDESDSFSTLESDGTVFKERHNLHNHN